MGATIRTQIVKIGNFQGICIPKLLEQSGIHAEVEIEVQGDHLTIRPAPHLQAGGRAGWDEAFSNMAQQQDDALSDAVNPNDWDQIEWEWSSSADQIRTIDKTRLIKKLGQLNQDGQKRVLDTLAEMFAQ
jgi:antitoxin MazE